MYTIISGTNRPNSKTLKIARLYRQLLEERGIEATLVSLEGLNVLVRNPDYIALEDKILIPASKFIFISPEYNGSIPGVLKCLFDISDIQNAWWGKKALLTGVSSGRAGNLRGMEHLTGILHFLKVSVHYNKLPISGVHLLLDGEGVLVDQPALSAINAQLDEFVVF